VRIATGCGLDDPVIESWSGRDFLHTSIPAQGLTQPPVRWVPALFPGVKRPSRVVDHRPPPYASPVGVHGLF